jgi:hypothetical protein
MAKKTTKKKATTHKKATAKKSKKKSPATKVDRIEIELDPAEVKAYELAHSSDTVRKELELAVTLSMAQAVRKVFTQHGVSLTLSQSQQVAVLLFGE